MSNKLKSVKVGVLSLLTIFLLYFGINFLKGINVMNNGRVFYAYYDNVSGLTEGNSVTVKGYKIGTITKINFDLEKENLLKVTLHIENGINIPLNTIAKIMSTDLMGTKGISLSLGDTSVMSVSGSELASSIESSLQDEVNAQILPLKNKTEQLIGSIDSVMTVITSVLNKDARESLTKSLVSLDRTFSTLSETMLVVDKMVNENEKNISTIMTNFTSISSNLNASNEEIKNIISNFSSISDSLAKADILSTLSSIDKITSKINNSEGSLGQLVNDKELYNNLKDASQELDELIADMKLHPERYLTFSILSTSKPYIEPKKEDDGIK
ncbi:MAG: MlaD family protein [Flavobacteriales bacterium]|tara:strand:- start:349 stop:1329 length:981 start_codon:yes stop_codon:yes gene_type:complete